MKLVALKPIILKAYEWTEDEHKKRERLISEAEITGKLKHKNIIKLIDVVYDKVKKSITLVLELCNGGKLDVIIFLIIIIRNLKILLNKII